MDNAGENLDFKKVAELEFPWIDFELTSPGTPQQNGKAERKFATLFRYAKAMLNDGGFDMNKRQGLWAEAAGTATRLHNLLVNENETESPYKKFYGKDNEIKNHLRSFGEVGIVTFRKGNKSNKIKNRGQPCVMVGYSSEHPKGTYQMFDPKTRKVILTRDVNWIGKNYQKWKKSRKELESDSETESEEEEIVGHYNKEIKSEDENKSESEDEPVEKVKEKREVRNLREALKREDDPKLKEGI